MICQNNQIAVMMSMRWERRIIQILYQLLFRWVGLNARVSLMPPADTFCLWSLIPMHANLTPSYNISLLISQFYLMWRIIVTYLSVQYTYKYSHIVVHITNKNHIHFFINSCIPCRSDIEMAVLKAVIAALFVSLFVLHLAQATQMVICNAPSVVSSCFS